MKTNILLSLLTGVLLLNGVAIFFWQRDSRSEHQHKRPPKITDVLNFSGDKEKMVDKLENEHFQQKDDLIAKQKSLRKELFLAENTPNRKDSLIQLIGTNQKAIESITLSYFTSIRKVCSEKQQKELNKLIEKMIQGPPHHHRKN